VLKKPHFALFLTILFLLTLTVPALAENNTRFSHTADYRIEGLISIDKEIGDPCTTGAAKHQSIKGYGEMSKSESIDIAPQIISVEDEIDWVTAEDAVRNLSVTSTIDLCALPMTTARQAFSPEVIMELIVDLIIDGRLTRLERLAEELNLEILENEIDDLDDEDDFGLADFDLAGIRGELDDLYENYNLAVGDPVSPYDPAVIEGIIGVRPETEQTWGSSVTPEPGHSGSYEADFIAAYGPGPRQTHRSRDHRWWYDDLVEGGIDRGDKYVGNYFDIDQYIYTSQGETRRYISISSPFSYALTEELMEVIGMAEVTETFYMDNLEPGPDAITLAWHELF